MIISINYANDKFKNSQRLNSKMAKKMGADKTIEYNINSLPADFRRENEHLFSYSRGGGYWVWKPYIILDALNNANENDIVIYTDSGAAFVRPIRELVEIMNRDKQDVMCFCIDQIERKWCKKDALILMDCDKSEYLDTAQICSGYIFLRNNAFSRNIISQWLAFNKDPRVVTDEANTLGKPNYPEFIENRHDQTIWSLLCKKNGIQPYRDPSEFGMQDVENRFAADVLERSLYPQVIESHRNGQLKYAWQLAYRTDLFSRVMKIINNYLYRLRFRNE